MAEQTPVVLDCTGCGATVALPTVPNKPGWVSIDSMNGWTAGTNDRGYFRLCPGCSETAEAIGGEGGVSE